MRCENCDYVCDTPLGSYCTLTNKAIETTDCHYEEQKAIDEDQAWLIRNMR